MFTGLRPSEEIALVLSDLDLANGIVSINKARVAGVDRCQTQTMARPVELAEAPIPPTLCRDDMQLTSSVRFLRCRRSAATATVNLTEVSIRRAGNRQVRLSCIEPLTRAWCTRQNLSFTENAAHLRVPQ